MERRKKNIIELTHCSRSQYKAAEKLPLIVMTDNVRSMYNIGSIFRTADAFMIEKIILGGISGTPPHPEISKTALGAEESVEWYHVGNSIEEVERLKNSGWKILALEQTIGSLPLQDFKPCSNEKYLLVVGNEVEGVMQEIVDISDVTLEIPQFGTKHSLNVSSGAAIAIWHIMNGMKLAGIM